jgi:hypothetical protein
VDVRGEQAAVDDALDPDEEHERRADAEPEEELGPDLEVVHVCPLRVALTAEALIFADDGLSGSKGIA